MPFGITLKIAVFCLYHPVFCEESVLWVIRLENLFHQNQRFLNDQNFLIIVLEGGEVYISGGFHFYQNRGNPTTSLLTGLTTSVASASLRNHIVNRWPVFHFMLRTGSVFSKTHQVRFFRTRSR